MLSLSGYKTVVTKLSFVAVASQWFFWCGYIVTKISGFFQFFKYFLSQIKNKQLYTFSTLFCL